jgi:hypothetical protein
MMLARTKIGLSANIATNVIAISIQRFSLYDDD